MTATRATEATTSSDVEAIAKVCHEANRAWSELLGEEAQPKWEDAPDWQRSSAIHGVEFHWSALKYGAQTSPRQSHVNWLKEKEAQGWKYGPVKDPEKKEHPCFVPWEELRESQKLKDYLFLAIIEAFFQAQSGNEESDNGASPQEESDGRNPVVS